MLTFWGERPFRVLPLRNMGDTSTYRPTFAITCGYKDRCLENVRANVYVNVFVYFMHVEKFGLKIDR